ncbi:hypothetical protein C9F11_18420 [Streptomyces sp. YIM 121038]|uniref:hypothetical protein n=1 Tax=Streptomyces sp. YIM 121038 TaxID=2136401 RepID=UPI0011109EF2|nr:hypothetical protein C9F11_18420 [Streptomyces sp. YIM 121038]
MTQQSGQGAASSDPRQPAERHAHEGIVLPADGGEPLMPGGHQAAPPVGSPWGEPWGPEPTQPPAGPGQSWGEGEAWADRGDAGAAPRPAGGMPLPPEGTPLPPSTPPQQSYGGGAGALPPEQHGTPGYGQPLPPLGQALPVHGETFPPAAQGRPLPPPGPAQGHPHAPPYSGQGYGYPPVDQGHAPPPVGHGQPLPPAGPVPPVPAAEHTQVLRPTDPHLPSPGQPSGPQGGPDAQATQYIPPVAPGALPPEMPPGGAGHTGHVMPAGDSTQFLGRADSTQFLGQAADVVPEETAFHGDNAPTQFIAPVTDDGPPAPAAAAGGYGERQPPAEFDSLFRQEPEGASATQQMPLVPAAPSAPDPVPEPASRRKGRTGSKTPLLVAVGVAIAVVGVGAGAMLAGGGGDAKAENSDSKEPLAATSSEAPDDEKSAKPSPSADPVKRQAVALDKLLADSNDSRESVIRAVRNVGTCKNLRQSATDLRDAAKQRNGLVGRLSGLTVDKLPSNGRLTAALNRAWKASASADDHYAAWADQVGGKKGCHKGRARTTPQTAAGNRASGEATKAKRQAAALWNAIADKHGLTKRNPTQL